MKKKTVCLLLTGMMLAGLTLGGCGTVLTPAEPMESETTDEDSQDDLPGTDLSDGGETGETVAATDQAMVNSIATADKIFADSDENGVFSPLSLNFALGLLYEGADGSTREEIASYLGTDDFTSFAKSYMNYVASLNSDGTTEMNGYKTAFEIGNSIWVNQNNCSISQDYASSVADYYDALIKEYDFTKTDALCKDVNSWCDEKTQGMIPDILSADMVSADSSAILVNALYFESPWFSCMSQSDQEETFSGKKGDQKTNFLYSPDGASAYFENDQATAFAYPYANGLEFIGILPKEEGDYTLESLDIPSLLDSETTEFDRLEIKMPALDYETSMDLTDVLPACGLETALSTEADYSGISDSPIVVDSIVQRAKIQLDENGTKAAAVTMEMMAGTAAPNPDPVIYQVYLDRPFAYMIYDSVNNQIVFIGEVNQL